MDPGRVHSVGFLGSADSVDSADWGYSVVEHALVGYSTPVVNIHRLVITLDLS